MRFRAVILGLFGVLFICGATYFNDNVMHQTMLVGNSLPVGVYGLLLLLLFLVNPLMQRLRLRAFSGRELAVAVAMSLAAAAIPGSGLLRTFTSTLLLPHHIERTEAGWQELDVLDMMPSGMLAAVDETGGDEVINGFIQGLGVGVKHIALSDVPWGAWIPALVFWVPIILAFWLALIGLALVVHRQWADHEQLPYPIARFTAALLPGGGGAAAEVLRSRLFLGGMLSVLAIHMLNYAVQWFPQTLIGVQLRFDFEALHTVFPTIVQGGGGGLLWPQIYFTVVAVAFLLASDVSLSLGIAPILFCYIAGVFVNFGISLTGGGRLALKPESFIGFGAYMGMFLSILYTGRHYYTSVFKKALMPQIKSGVPVSSVWGARLFLGAFVLLVVLMSNTGLDWQLALLYTSGILIVLLVLGRIIAETGLFFIQSWTFICVTLLGFFGVRNMGPETMLILFFFTNVLFIDLRESLMPFLMNGFKTVDLTGGALGKTTVWCIVAMVVGLGVAIPVQLYVQYDYGANMSDRWATTMVPRMAIDETVRIAQRLDAQGTLEEANALSGWARFRSMSPDRGSMVAFGSGLVLVGIFAFARLHFPKWPLHPVIFLVWSSYAIRQFWFAFLLGSLLKRTVVKYGGAGAYRKLQPLMFGIIAGEISGALITAIIGSIYFFVTGEVPRRFRIMPG